MSAPVFRNALVGLKSSLGSRGKSGTRGAPGERNHNLDLLWRPVRCHRLAGHFGCNVDHWPYSIESHLPVNLESGIRHSCRSRTRLSERTDLSACRNNQLAMPPPSPPASAVPVSKAWVPCLFIDYGHLPSPKSCSRAVHYMYKHRS